MNQIIREILTIILRSFAVLVVFGIGLWMFDISRDGRNKDAAPPENVVENNISDEPLCTIEVVPIVGRIIPYAGADADEEDKSPSTNADDVLALLHKAQADKNIKGVLIRIDSFGGAVLGAEIIANTLKRLSLPSVALVRESGTSAGYLIATGAKTIIASPFSDIGSIGVTMSYLENIAKNAKAGSRYIPLASARFKDYGNPNKPLTPAERALFERDLKILHTQFVKEIAENRHLPVKHVAKLADGSSMPGLLALKNKLIDALGDQETARAWFAEQLKMPVEEVAFCE